MRTCQSHTTAWPPGERDEESVMTFSQRRMREQRNKSDENFDHFEKILLQRFNRSKRLHFEHSASAIDQGCFARSALQTET